MMPGRGSAKPALSRLVPSGGKSKLCSLIYKKFGRVFMIFLKYVYHDADALSLTKNARRRPTQTLTLFML
ncbi:hypothetical protein TIFTF001_021279 [Ficus carica]|uniref:Uncharacterized protein n=1 Tax=Ficus carica TaxID=3494 RepID=A0AA88AH75_FICCA|nr:hypothetical protein TIFTF001_021279 [Ficus carica]